jgi:ABC-type branched-subunit amino acid transport system ATPase component
MITFTTPPAPFGPALETIHLEKRFGGLVATKDVTFQLAHGARHALIGPNGAGKTTFVNQLSGVLQPTSGQIKLNGVDITRVRPDLRVKQGLARTFQINQLFKDLTPRETIGIAVAQRLGSGGRMWRSFAADPEIAAEAEALLASFRLADVADARTASLAYGKQRLLEIAVAIAAKPKVLLLDEPAAGVPEAERHEILGAVKALPPDVAILLIEHDMDLVFAFADRITVLVEGALLVDGTPAEIAADPRVKAVYLGSGDHGH